MNNRKSILLISYVFPPYAGIGGRRWARHAQQLSKLGYTVHVVSAKNPFKKTSLWWDYIKDDPNIVLHALPSKYPDVILKKDLNIFQKITYKFWMRVLPLLTNRNYFDRTIFWKETMLQKADELIKKNTIENVICTGGPFGAMYYATLLKKEFPKLFIVSDLRDPWTWAPNWGFPGLSQKRMTVEKEIERATMENSDVITVPAESLKNELIQRYPEYEEKIKILPHFVDTSEISEEAKSKSDKIRLLLYGTVYIDSEPFLTELAAFLVKHPAKFTLDIYTENTNAQSIFRGVDNVSFHEPVPPKTLYLKFKNYDYVLMLQPAYARNAISTKFYEVIYSRTPVIILSEQGAAAEFIVKNNLGYHATKGTIAETLLKLTPEMNSYNRSFDTSAFTLENITQSLVTILEKRSLKESKLNS